MVIMGFASSTATTVSSLLHCLTDAIDAMDGTVRTIVFPKSTTAWKRKRKAEKVVERIKPEKEEKKKIIITQIPCD